MATSTRSTLALASISLLSLLTAAEAGAQSFYGSSCVDSAGNFPRVDYPASSWISNPSTNETVSLVGGIPGSNAVLFLGGAPVDRLAIDLSIIGGTGCTLSVNPFAQRPAVVGMNGNVDVSFPGFPSGFEFLFQWVLIDPAAPRPLTIVTTDALQAGPPAQPNVYRITDLDLRDPHLSVPILFGCADITDTAAVGGLVPSFNGTIQDQIQMDADGDNNLDLNLNLIFRPDGANGGSLDFLSSDCTAATATTVTTCTIPTAQPLFRAPYQDGVCLAPIAGTTGGYTPAVAAPSGNCFTTSQGSFSLGLPGFTLALENGQVSGEFSSSNPPRIVNGLIAGFVPESTLDAIIIPATIPIIGGNALSSLFAGGTGNCSTQDDRDIGPSGASGWWIYINFEADAVPTN